MVQISWKTYNRFYRIVWKKTIVPASEARAKMEELRHGDGFDFTASAVA